MFDLYEAMLAAYKTGDRDKYMPAARKWFQACTENPFKSDARAHEAFFQASYHFQQWTAGGINSRVSKIRYNEALEELVKLKATNPYTKVEPVPLKKNAKPVSHILGVVPETAVKKEPISSSGSKNEQEPVQNTDELTASKTTANNVEKKGLFSWLRKRAENDG